MKTKHIIASLGLAALIGVGAAIGLTNGNKITAAKAADLQSYSGSLAIELQDLGEGHYWDDDNAKLGAKIYNSEDSGEMGDCWTELLQTTSGTHRYVLHYTTTNYFDPFAGSHTKIDLYRFKPEATNCATAFSEGQYWNHADGLSMGNVLYVYEGNACSSVKYYVGAESDSWNASAGFVFRNAKINNGNFELFGDFDLAADDQFKIVQGTSYYGNYSTHVSLSETFVGGGSNNIGCAVAGTYSLFHKLSDHETYITTPTLAAADEWAQEFLGANCEATKAGWSSAATSYDTLSASVKALFVAEEHVGKDETTATYYQAAVQRYDYVLEMYGVSSYADFMGRVAAGKVTPKTSNTILNVNNNNGVVLLVVITSIIAISSVTFVLVLKKRKYSK